MNSARILSFCTCTYYTVCVNEYSFCHCFLQISYEQVLKMYKVSNSLNSSYGPDVDPIPMKNEQKKSLEKSLPISSTTRKMIKKKQAEADENPKPSKPTLAEIQSGSEKLKSLRYDPNLVCDPHLESLRPSRDMKHIPLPTEDLWKKKLIKKPKTFEGSFADADMENFRPEPNPPPIQEDPWYASRVPEGNGNQFPAFDRLAGAHYDPDTNPYDKVYPQDELSQIKMRNRQFQQANPNGFPESNLMQGPNLMYPPQQQMMPMYNPFLGMPMYHPMMGSMPPMMPQPFMPTPAPNGDDVLHDLKILDQELNTTRRVTRPYVPTTPNLQRQRDLMEEPAMSTSPTFNRPSKEFCPKSIDELPPPKPILAREKAPETAALATPAMKSCRPEVRIADQIATRAIVLGKNLPPLSKLPSKAHSKTSSKLSSPRSRSSVGISAEV